jgi:hypothetical protein
MRLSRLPVLLAGAALLGVVSCATTIEGTGSIAAGVVTPGPSGSSAPTGDPTSTGAPTETADPTTSVPTPTTNPAAVKQRLLCVLEQATIVSINSQFNKTKDRAAQIAVLRTGASTIRGHLSRSGLPATDKVRRPGQSVVDQLDRLVTNASGGGSPSTAPYNLATRNFQKACSAVR